MLSSPLLLIAAPILAIIVAVIFGYLLPSLKRKRLRHTRISIVPLASEGRPVIPPRPERPPVAPPVQQRDQSQVVTPVMNQVIAESVANAASVAEMRAHQQPAEEARPVLKLQVAGDNRPVAHKDVVTHNTLRLEKVTDGTLQFLPGKLEVIEGRDIGQEVRFVKTPGPDGNTITFGRVAGPQYRHVQLLEQTVSREHARMTFEGKSWTLTNLSRTNPVSVNGLALSEKAPSVTLRDGDRIEMGEVVFRFRSR